MNERNKIKRYLRKEINKIPTASDLKKRNEPFAFCYAQARFDALMDIDIELDLGAFTRREKLRDRKG